MHRRRILPLLLAALALSPLTAQAEPRAHEVKMWSDGGLKYFMPDYLEVATGDTVRFVNMSGHHNTEGIAGMIPAGANAWNSDIDETFDLLITQPDFTAICARRIWKKAWSA